MAVSACRTALQTLQGSSGCWWACHFPGKSSKLFWQRLPSWNLEAKQWANIQELISQFCLIVCTQWMLKNPVLAWQKMSRVAFFHLQRIDNLWHIAGCTNGTSLPALHQARAWKATCFCSFLGWLKNFYVFTRSLGILCERRLFPNDDLITQSKCFISWDFWKSFPSLNTF